MEAIRDLIRDHLVTAQWDKKRDAVGTITIVYDHHVHDLTDKLTSIQHEFHKLILSTMHVHFDHDHCLEVLVVKGRGLEVKTVADSLISTKGVKHGKPDDDDDRKRPGLKRHRFLLDFGRVSP